MHDKYEFKRFINVIIYYYNYLIFFNNNYMIIYVYKSNIKSIFLFDYYTRVVINKICVIKLNEKKY